eukprot:gene14644-16163_t
MTGGLLSQNRSELEEMSPPRRLLLANMLREKPRRQRRFHLHHYPYQQKLNWQIQPNELLQSVEHVETMDKSSEITICNTSKET